MGEDDPSVEPSSLEYIEDSYLPKLDDNVTPSLDEIQHDCDDICDGFDENDIGICQWSEETELYLRSLTLDQILSIPDDLIDDMNMTEMQTVETEFSPINHNQSVQLNSPNKFKNYLASTNRFKFFTKKKMLEVKVTFVDFSKPYLAKISSGDNYKKFLNIGDQQGLGEFLHFDFISLYLDPKRRYFDSNWSHSFLVFNSSFKLPSQKTSKLVPYETQKI